MRFPGFRIFLALALGSFFACSSNEPEEPDSNATCFVGDPITYFWDLEKYFPDITSQKTAVVGARIADLDVWNIQTCKGKTTVFLMGTNDIGGIYSNYVGADSISKVYADSLIERALRLGGKPLLYISILPRNFKYEQDTLVNAYLRLQNEVIVHKLDSLGADYRYIDVFDDFIEKGNVLDSTLFNDGLHPNEKGYEILTAKVKPYLY